jgi:hypothetical protein
MNKKLFFGLLLSINFGFLCISASQASQLEELQSAYKNYEEKFVKYAELHDELVSVKNFHQWITPIEAGLPVLFTGVIGYSDLPFMFKVSAMTIWGLHAALRVGIVVQQRKNLDGNLIFCKDQMAILNTKLWQTEQQMLAVDESLILSKNQLGRLNTKLQQTDRQMLALEQQD